MADIRHRVDPRDVPLAKAARRLHLTRDEFRLKLPELIERGFPRPDPTTGHYSLNLIDEWMDARDRRLSRRSSAAIDDPDEVTRRIEGI